MLTPVWVSMLIACSVVMHVVMVYNDEHATSIFDVLAPRLFDPTDSRYDVDEYVLQDTLSKPLLLNGTHLHVEYSTDMRTRAIHLHKVQLMGSNVFTDYPGEELFSISFSDIVLHASDCTLVEARSITVANIQIEFLCPRHDHRFVVLWQASLLHTVSAEVLKVDIDFTREGYVHVVGAEVTLFRMRMTEEAKHHGEIGEQSKMPGIPLTGEHSPSGRYWWLSVEHPRATNFRSLLEGVMTGSLTLSSVQMRVSASFGVSLVPSLPIAFSEYLESFRPLPDPMMFYNTAYDLVVCDAGCTQMEEARAMTKENVDELVLMAHPHKVLLDDGWDSLEGPPWRPAFELPPLDENSKSYGLWISPTGGHRHNPHETDGNARTRRNERIGENIPADARLSNIAYFAFMKDTLNRLDVKGAAFAMDKVDTLYKPDELDSLLELVKDLPLVLLATKDLWASPWFLLYFHALWRGGTDLGEVQSANNTSSRQKMRTFRDMNIFKIHERSNNLFPLRRVLNNGVIWSSIGTSHFDGDTSLSFRDEVDYYFAEGQLIKQVLVDSRTLAPADRQYMHAQYDIVHTKLRSLSHVQYFGGDPSSEAYGLLNVDSAAQKGVFRLRNPLQAVVTMTVSRQVLSLPSATLYDAWEIYSNLTRMENRAMRLPFQVSLLREQVRFFELFAIST